MSKIAYSFLALLADQLDDFEDVRIRQQNRLRSLGTFVPPTDPLIVGLAAVVDVLSDLEKNATKDLTRALRTNPLAPWVAATVGVGQKQGARLLAAIGDPYIKPAMVDRDTGQEISPARPRTVSELWAYCGLHVLHPGHRTFDAQPACAGVDPLRLGHTVTGAQSLPAQANPLSPSQARNDTRTSVAGTASPGGDLSLDPFELQSSSAGVAARRAKGQRANWNPRAKSRAYLVAVSCMKQRHSPYRKVYDDRRAHTAITHPEWSDGHSHNDALRVTSKQILKDLWREARRLHGDGDDPLADDPRPGPSTDPSTKKAGAVAPAPAEEAAGGYTPAGASMTCSPSTGAPTSASETSGERSL